MGEGEILNSERSLVTLAQDVASRLETLVGQSGQLPDNWVNVENPELTDAQAKMLYPELELQGFKAIVSARKIELARRQVDDLRQRLGRAHNVVVAWDEDRHKVISREEGQQHIPVFTVDKQTQEPVAIASLWQIRHGRPSERRILFMAKVERVDMETGTLRREVKVFRVHPERIGAGKKLQQGAKLQQVAVDLDAGKVIGAEMVMDSQGRATYDPGRRGKFESVLLARAVGVLGSLVSPRFGGEGEG